jgi:hypothetical protein
VMVPLYSTVSTSCAATSSPSSRRPLRVTTPVSSEEGDDGPVRVSLRREGPAQQRTLPTRTRRRLWLCDAAPNPHRQAVAAGVCVASVLWLRQWHWQRSSGTTGVNTCSRHTHTHTHTHTMLPRAAADGLPHTERAHAACADVGPLCG